MSRLPLPPRSTTYNRRCGNHSPPLSIADACNHVQPPTGRGHRGRAMPRELELHHPQPVPLQVAHPTNHTIFFSLSILLPLCFCSSRCFKKVGIFALCNVQKFGTVFFRICKDVISARLDYVKVRYYQPRKKRNLGL